MGPNEEREIETTMNEVESDALKAGTFTIELNESQTTKMTLKERLKLIKDNTTVEPIMACYITPSVIAALAVQNLSLDKACRVNLNYTDEICTALTLRQTENYTTHEEAVQTLTASMQVWANVIQTAIPVFLILFVGAWTDRTGKRKACILIPVLGELLSCLGLIVNTYYFDELPVEAALMTQVIFPAFTGGWYVNSIGVYSYICDMTSVENRTYRIGLIDMLMTLAYPVGSALSGILLNVIGYYGIFCLSSVMYLFSLIYGYYYLVEPQRKEPCLKENKSGLLNFLRDFFDFSLVPETFKVIVKNNSWNRRIRIVCLLLVVFIVLGPQYGEFTVLYLFTRFRFNWDEIQFSIWSSYAMIVNLSGTLFSMNLFSKYMKVDDTILGIISSSSKIIAGFMYAFARNNFEIYLAPVIEILNGTSYIAMRSIATKLVHNDDVGKVNSLIGLAEAMTPLIYSPLYTSVYIATLHYLPGAVFLLGSVLTLPAIAIFGWMFFAHKSDKLKDQTTQIEVTEKFLQ